MRRRLLSGLLDYNVVLGWLILLAAVFVPLYLAGFQGWVHHTDVIAFAASILPTWLYLTLTETRTGATWGKRRAGLRVVGPDGAPAGPARIGVRNAVKLVPWQLAHLGVAGLLTTDALVDPALAWIPVAATYGLVALTVTLVLARRDRAALHDLVAGTRVVPVQVAPLDEPAVAKAVLVG